MSSSCDKSGVCWLQDLETLLATLGDTLRFLRVHIKTNFPADFNFSCLKTVPNLQSLRLEYVSHELNQEDVEKGLACLR